MDDQLLKAAQNSVRCLLRQEEVAIINLGEYEDDLQPLLNAVAKRARAGHDVFGKLPAAHMRPPEMPFQVPAENPVPMSQWPFSHLLEPAIHGVQAYVPRGFAQLRFALVAPLVAAAILLGGGSAGLAAKGPEFAGTVLGVFSWPAASVENFVNGGDPILLPPVARADPPGQDDDPNGPPIDPPEQGDDPYGPPIDPPEQGDDPNGPPIDAPGQDDDPYGPPIDPPGQNDDPYGPPIDPPEQGDDPNGPPIDPPGSR